MGTCKRYERIKFCRGAFIYLGGKFLHFCTRLGLAKRDFSFAESIDCGKWLNQAGIRFLMSVWLPVLDIFLRLLGDVICHAFLYTRQEIVENFYIHSVFVTIFTERTRCCIVEGLFIVFCEMLAFWGICFLSRIFFLFLFFRGKADSPWPTRSEW